MIIEIGTAIHHATDALGKEREEDCCGCWHIFLDESARWPVYARCNECGEYREIGHTDLVEIPAAPAEEPSP